MKKYNFEDWLEFTCKPLPKSEKKRYLIYVWWSRDGNLTYADKEVVKDTIQGKAMDGYESFDLSIWDTEKNEELDWKKLIEVKDF